MILVCDTGPLVAAINRRDRHHELSLRVLTGEPRTTLVVPATVAVEVDYLVRSRMSDVTARAFLRDVDEGRYVLAPVGSDVFRRAVELDAQHADVGLGLVDASVVAVAEAYEAGAIATLDHAHLGLASPPGVSLVPDPSEL